MIRPGPRRTTLFSTFAVLLVCACGVSAPASASRAPSKVEKRQIRKAAVADCRKRGEQGCRAATARVSTVDERYAFGGAAGRNYYNGALLKRDASSRRWRVLEIQGGGAVNCSTWTRLAPPAVLNDLGLEGLSEDASSFGPCNGGPFVNGFPCDGNRGAVAGTGGIYLLRAKGIGCEGARAIVRDYHAQRAAQGGETQTVSGFECQGSYTENAEGLQVRCDGPAARRVTWTAYLDY